MQDYWIGAGCTSWEFARRDPRYHPEVPARHRYLSKVNKKKDQQPWPFQHGVSQIDAPWYAKHINSWGLDPLVIPLLQELNKIPGVNTWVSCQGNANWGPSISFLGNLEAAQTVLEMLQPEDAHEYYNCAIVAITGKQEVRGKRDAAYFRLPAGIYDSWNIWFYDTLALMQYNRDFLDISIAEQCNMYLPKMCEGHTHDEIPRANPNEIEEILDCEES